MDYKEFKEYVVKSIKQRMEPGTNVSVHEVKKNNGVILDGLTILRPEKNVSPTIYLRELYDKISNGGFTPDEAVEEIIRLHKENEVENLNVGQFTDFNGVRQHLYPRIVNGSGNEDFLADIPHRKVLDLAIIYYQEASKTPFGAATRVLNNQDLERWGISEEELHNIAMENMHRDKPADVMTMPSLFGEFGLSDEDVSYASKNMWVISNKERYFGAMWIAEPEVFKPIAEKVGGNLFILPSSIHELIAVPANLGESDEFKNMVMEINRTQVPEQEILSDSVYLYDKEKNEVSVAA